MRRQRPRPEDERWEQDAARRHPQPQREDSRGRRMRRHPPQEQGRCTEDFRSRIKTSPLRRQRESHPAVAKKMPERRNNPASAPIEEQRCPLMQHFDEPAADQWNKNSINVLLGHFVISAGTKVEDLERLIEQTPLHVIYVVIDVHGDRREMMAGLFTAVDGNRHRSCVWGSMQLPVTSNGFMLYKRGAVKCVEQVSAITSHSDSCTQVAHRVTLAAGPKTRSLTCALRASFVLRRRPTQLRVGRRAEPTQLRVGRRANGRQLSCTR